MISHLGDINALSNPSVFYIRSKPARIFIALLWVWEILCDRCPVKACVIYLQISELHWESNGRNDVIAHRVLFHSALKHNLNDDAWETAKDPIGFKNHTTLVCMSN